MARQENAQNAGFTPVDLIRIFRRRLIWFAAPALAVMTAALVVALVWPAVYEAAAVIAIEPQEVPENLVGTTVVSGTEARFNRIRLRIMARDHLSRIIDQFNLYPDEDGPRENKIEAMRAHIVIEPLPPAIVDPRKPVEIESFKIAFQSHDPVQAAQVANQLTRDFQSQNITERTREAESTASFIGDNLAAAQTARSSLLEELAAYKLENTGSLPEDEQLNQQRLDRLTSEYARSMNDIQTATRQIEKINSRIAEVRANGTDPSYDPVRRKRTLELQLQSLLAQGKTAKHPDVLMTRAELENLETLIADETGRPHPISPEEASLQNELRHYEVHLAVVSGDRQRLETAITEYEEKISAAQGHATRIGNLETQITNLTEEIRNLQQRLTIAKLGENVEQSMKGEKFRLVEQAEPPSDPVSPNRPLVFVVGTVLGLGLGLLMLIVREMGDQSYRTAAQLQDELQLPVLGMIPVIRLPAELARARARLRRLVVVGAIAFGLIAGSGVAIYLLQQPGEPQPEAPAPAAKQAKEPPRV